MKMTALSTEEERAFNEQIARFNLLSADINRRQQEIRHAPIQLALASMGAGAALFAAALAFFKVVLGTG